MGWITILVGVVAAVGLARLLLPQVRKLMVEPAEAIRAWREVRLLLQCRQADPPRRRRMPGVERRRGTGATLLTRRDVTEKR